MTINQKATVLATLDIRMETIRLYLDRETAPERRAAMTEALDDLEDARAAVVAIEAEEQNL